MNMKDVFFFNAMLTPKIITFVYWLLLFSLLFRGLAPCFPGSPGSVSASFLLVA